MQRLFQIAIYVTPPINVRFAWGNMDLIQLMIASLVAQAFYIVIIVITLFVLAVTTDMC